MTQSFEQAITEISKWIWDVCPKCGEHKAFCPEGQNAVAAIAERFGKTIDEVECAIGGAA